ncbi:hypothetical protein RchiOBHm_Chr2g0132641 [Rosa chinensis]|uniref:Uncharacterized protein n=1 Tax=Rosa chinensis TaxID=74649 RepID=A0A2P6RVE3_ROSCH|nr:hypothetical protein RchiOBHm_Chr2g0132641 [Rosa chinensis]
MDWELKIEIRKNVINNIRKHCYHVGPLSSTSTYGLHGTGEIVLSVPTVWIHRI